MSNSREQLKVDYEKTHSLAIQFSNELNRQINSLIEKSGVKLGFPIQQRVKSWNSIEEKIERLNIRLDSVDELQDLVGLRLTLVFLRDADFVKSLIKNTFNILKSYNTSDRLKKDQFGYSSFHLVIKCPDEWCAVPSLSHLKDFKAEIQIRTLAQHIWAEVSHQLQYKNEENVPGEILRSIYRSSALLETIDLEFERVLIERQDYRADLKREESAIDENINSDNLDVLLEELLPKENKDDSGENYSLLISDFNALKIKKISEVRKIIFTHREAMLLEEERTFRQNLNDYNEYGDIQGTSEARMDRGVFFNFVGLTRQALKEEYGEDKVGSVISSSENANNGMD